MIPARLLRVCLVGCLLATSLAALPFASAPTAPSPSSPIEQAAATQAAEKSAEKPGDKPADALVLPTERTITFTTDEVTWMSVDVSSDGRTVVFDVLGDLYTMPIAGGEATRNRWNASRCRSTRSSRRPSTR